MKLLRRPANDWSMLFRDGGWFPARHLFEHGNLAVAKDKLCGNAQIEQAGESFTWHRARKHIASDHHMVYVCLTNILEYSLKRWEIRMNIVDRSDSHAAALVRG